MDSEQEEQLNRFLAKLKKVIDILDEREDKCLICEKKTFRHLAIFGGTADGSDLGLGVPKEGFRYGIAPICEEHDLTDPDIKRQVRISIEIKALANRKKILNMGTVDDIISDEEINGEVA